MTDWALERWGCLRVAGVPTAVLDDLRMQRAPAVWVRLRASEEELDRWRDRLVDAVYGEVSSVRANRADRRRLLAVKRDLHNRRPLSSLPSSPALDPCLLADLAELAVAESRCRELTAVYDRVAEEEWAACQQALQPWLADERLLGGLLLSNPGLAGLAMAAAQEASPKLSRRRLRTLAAVGTYLLRAATRPTPFSTFCAVGLVDWDHAATGVSDPRRTRSERGEVRMGVGYGLLRRRVEEAARRRGSNTVPLAATPWRVVDDGSVIYRGQEECCAETPSDHWHALDRADAAAVLEQLGAGRPSAKLTRRLDQQSLDGRTWAGRVEELLATGFLHVRPPAFNPTVEGLRSAAAYVEHVTGASPPWREVADRLAAYAPAAAARRLELLTEVACALECSGAERGVLYEDVFLSGTKRAPVAPGQLLEAVRPALDLVHCSLTDLPHMLMCEAFLDRYGLDGRCEDVGGFLTSLWRDGAVLRRIRDTYSVPAWVGSPLARAAEAAAYAVECDPSWFARLPKVVDRCSVALFFQLRLNPEATQRPQVQVVLDDVQSGRAKYLSRYLSENGDAGDALRDIRASLAGDTPLPIEVRATQDHNFQIHPDMCPGGLAVGDPAEPRSGMFGMSDLALTFDPEARELVLMSRALDRRVEPLHLGFLRDGNLPAPILLLRALSPRCRDETVSERVAVHGFLDGLCLAGGGALPPFRPRLTIGPLVLERARWAVPIREVPLPGRGRRASEHVRDTLAWLAARQLPDQCTAQVWQKLTGGRRVLSTPAYLDWHSPYAAAVLRSLLRQSRRNPGSSADWLILREVLPLPADASTILEGEPHASQWMAQFRLGG